jgi:hypothetical protein
MSVLVMCTNVVTVETVAVDLGRSTATRKRTHGICCSAHRTRRTLSRLHNVLKHSSRLIVGMSVAMTAAVATIASMTILIVVTRADEDTAAARRAVSLTALCRTCIVTSLRSWPRTQHPPFAPTYRS